MYRKRGKFVPIGEDLAALPAAIFAASPQARHSFTVADQVHQLSTITARFRLSGDGLCRSKRVGGNSVTEGTAKI